jgi:hypothetical protein
MQKFGEGTCKIKQKPMDRGTKVRWNCRRRSVAERFNRLPLELLAALKPSDSFYKLVLD